MIVYFDSSALVKRYIAEPASTQVETLLAEAAVAGTSLITRAEVAIALAKAVRVNWLTRDEALRLLKTFQQHWSVLFRLNLREATIERAEGLAWEHGLRGYDAVHLATALLWQSSLSEPVTLATFDRQLWDAARLVGLEVWPEAL
jgi:predicted nucleic acid-binding protein